MCLQRPTCYRKLVKVHPTTAASPGAGKDEVDKFWADAAGGGDKSTHNLKQGVGAYLTYLEKFHSICGNNPGYTTAGNTVGECKLFSSLHNLVMLQEDVLKPFPGVSGFYEGFKAMPQTALMIDGSKFPHALPQYFTWQPVDFPEVMAMAAQNKVPVPPRA